MTPSKYNTKLAAISFAFISTIASASEADCIAKEFVTSYCYIGLADHLNDDAIAVEPKQYGYEASTIVEIMRQETVQYVVTCDSGPKPIQNFTRVVREEKELISEERLRWADAISDLKHSYGRLRARINNYLCTP